MKKSHKTTIVTLCILALTISIATIVLLNFNTTNTSQKNPQTSNYPTTPTNTPFTTSSNDPTQQLTFHGVPIYSCKIIQTYPHDSSAFTQGLTFGDDGYLI